MISAHRLQGDTKTPKRSRAKEEKEPKRAQKIKRRRSEAQLQARDGGGERGVLYISNANNSYGSKKTESGGSMPSEGRDGMDTAAPVLCL